MKIGVIIQARMGSTRLPGKILKDLSGQPLLWHVIDRVKRCKKVDEIVLAITASEKDDVLESFAEDIDISFFRGSEEDVLGRYVDASRKYEIDLIIRITSDCPLIDPVTIDRLIQSHMDEGADYSSNTLKRSFPKGLDSEIFSRQLLELANQHALIPYQREHVTLYFYESASKFKLNNLFADKDLNYPEFRLCVDTTEDLELMKELYKRLYKPPEIIDIKKVIELLKKELKLSLINKDIKQKSLYY